MLFKSTDQRANSTLKNMESFLMEKRRVVKRIPQSLQQAIEETIKNPAEDLTIEQIADECGVCPSMVYRWTKDPDTSSYAKLTLDNFRKLIDLTKNYAILDYFERRIGRIAINVPKGIMPKHDEDDMLDDYRELTVEVIKLLLRFFKHPSNDNKLAVESSLEEVMKQTASLKKYCGKKAAGQLEMDLN